MNAELVCVVCRLRGDGHVTHHDVRALLGQDATFGLDHGVLLRVVAQHCSQIKSISELRMLLGKAIDTNNQRLSSASQLFLEHIAALNDRDVAWIDL